MAALSGGFLDLYETFEPKINKYKSTLDLATDAWEKRPTDPGLTLKIQAAQGDLGNVSRVVGSLISSLVSLQSEIAQKFK